MKKEKKAHWFSKEIVEIAINRQHAKVKKDKDLKKKFNKELQAVCSNRREGAL